MLGPPPSISAPLLNRKFIGIARVAGLGGYPAQRFATLSEAADGGSSMLDTWATDAGFVLSTRVVAWSDMHVQAIGSATDGRMAIGGVSGTNMLVLEYVEPTNFFAPSNPKTLSAAGPAGRVVRIRGVNSTAAPLMVLFDGVTANEARWQLPVLMGNTFGLQSFSSGLSGAVTADDLVSTPFGGITNAVVVTGRCQGQCTFAGVMGSMTLRSVGHLGWTEYDPTTGAINAAAAGSFRSLTSGAVSSFNEASAIRAATDGNAFIYLAGQGSSGELVIQPWTHTSPAPQPSIISTGPLTLVDFIRGPTGVLLLARLNAAGVSFGGPGLPWTASNLGNVVVLRIDNTGALSARTWDLPGDQRPVAFEHAEGQLAILVNEGPDALLWRVPTP